MRRRYFLPLMFLTGCMSMDLPKVVTIRYHPEMKMSTVYSMSFLIVCVRETRADTPPVTYECDTGQLY